MYLNFHMTYKTKSKYKKKALDVEHISSQNIWQQHGNISVASARSPGFKESISIHYSKTRLVKKPMWRAQLETERLKKSGFLLLVPVARHN